MGYSLKHGLTFLQQISSFVTEESNTLVMSSCMGPTMWTNQIL